MDKPRIRARAGLRDLETKRFRAHTAASLELTGPEARPSASAIHLRSTGRTEPPGHPENGRPQHCRILWLGRRARAPARRVPCRADSTDMLARRISTPHATRCWSVQTRWELQEPSGSRRNRRPHAARPYATTDGSDTDRPANPSDRVWRSGILLGADSRTTD